MPKQHPADAEAERILALQRAAYPATRRRDIVLIAVCSVLILALAVGIYLLPHRSFSETENTALQTFPKFTFSRLFSGKFMAELGDFYTDQFPARDTLVAAKAAAELGMGKIENNAVILGRDDHLIKRIEYSDHELATLRANLDAVTEFRATAGRPVTFALAPRAIDVLGSYLPSPGIGDRAKAVWTMLDAYADGEVAGQPTMLSLRAPLTALADAGEPVWYRTDHHWTTLGAYHAYAALGDACGYVPYAPDRFTVETAADDFLGTTYSAAGMSWIAGENLDFWRYDGDTAFTVEVLLNGEVTRTMADFYDRDYLEKKDKYSAFLSSNNGHMRIRLPGEERPTLLLIKDSFAHSVAPFLARHYDLEILDLRYYRGSVADLLATTAIDRVLILVGVDTLATSNLFAGLNAGFGA